MREDLVVVIMAGGAGTRFWPASTARRPKQFLELFGDRSLLQQSYDRARALVTDDHVMVLTGADHVDLVREQLPDLPEVNVVGEPARRDTAAAVALGAALVRERFGDVAIATVTADHRIDPLDRFVANVESAVEGAIRSDALYTFGIRPTYPAQGYGYLEVGDDLGLSPEVEHRRVERFVEKPDAETARRYVESGRYLWNSGMFVWRASTILEAYERYLPDHLERLAPAVACDRSPAFWPALARAFDALEKISVDYAIMEQAGEVRCVEADFSWSDVGGWLAVADLLASDADENARRGKLATLDARGNLAFCDDTDETVVLIGVEDLIVVRSGPRTLVVPKSRAEDVKKVVERLAEGDR